jgi:uncharacterized protein YcnI
VKNIKLIAISALLACQNAAFSHVVLEQQAASVGESYRAVFRVGHGCDGLATTGITVQIPPGVQGAKPMPKAGWTLTVRKEPLATPYTSHGKQITEDVTEVSWTASSPEAALPESHYDEFVLRAGMPAKPGPVWFKVIQDCKDGNKTGRNAWTQVPAEGVSAKGLKSPAVLLQVQGKATEAHQH